MHIAIIGAGIVGVTTAHELALLGMQVTVFERRAGVASEASFAGAGIVSPGRLASWPAPGSPGQLLRGLFGGTTPVRIGGLNALAQLPWLWRWTLCSRAKAQRGNSAALHRLAAFSRERLLELTRTLALDYEQMPGCLVLLRDARALKSAQAALALLREFGVAHDVVDAARARTLEPGLHSETPLHAAIHLPQDGVGNCRQFAQLLKAEAQRLGVRFRFDSPVHALQAGAQPGLQTQAGETASFDAIVVCAGVQANALLASVGLRLPLAAVHAYSVTAPLRHLDGHPQPGPRGALMDDRHGVSISRLGQRVRVAGCAEIGGTLEQMPLKPPKPLRALYRVLDDWFPGAALTREAQHWKGAQAMLPDGPPVLGDSGAPGIWLNLGHGASGWALACGSARVLAERIAGREAPLDTSGLTLARLRR